MSTKALRQRLDRLHPSPASSVMLDAIDRPPQETRDEWIARMAARAEGRPHASTAVNANGETREQWEARRLCALDASFAKNVSPRNS